MSYTKFAGGIGGMPSTSSFPNLRKVSEPGMDFSGSGKSTTSSYGSTSTNYSNVKPPLVNQNSSNSNTEIVDMTKSVVSNGPANSSPSNTSVNYSGTPTNQRMGALGTYSATAYGSAPSFAKTGAVQAVVGTNAMEQPNMLDNPNARNVTDAATNKGNLYQTTAPGGAVTKLDILGSAGKTLDKVIEKVACYSTHPEEDVFRRILRRKGEQALVNGDKDTAVKMAAAMNALDLLPILVEDENDKVAAADAAAEAAKSNNVKSTENDVDKLSADANSFTDRFWDWLKENGSVADTPGEEQKSWWKQPTSYILPGALAAGTIAYGLSGRGGNFRNWVRKIGGLGIQDQAGNVTGRINQSWNPISAFYKRAVSQGVKENRAKIREAMQTYNAELTKAQNAYAGNVSKAQLALDNAIATRERAISSAQQTYESAVAAHAEAQRKASEAIAKAKVEARNLRRKYVLSEFDTRKTEMSGPWRRWMRGRSLPSESFFNPTSQLPSVTEATAKTQAAVDEARRALDMARNNDAAITEAREALRLATANTPEATGVLASVTPEWMNPAVYRTEAERIQARRNALRKGAFVEGAKKLFSGDSSKWDRRLGMTAGLGTAAAAQIANTAGLYWDDPDSTGKQMWNNIVRHPLSSGLAVGLAAPAIFTNRIGLRQSVTQPGRQALQNLGLGVGGLIGYEKVVQPTAIGNMLDEYIGRRNRSVSDRPIRSTALGGAAGAGLGFGAAYLANKYGNLDYGIDDYAKYTTAGAALGAGAGYAANNLFRNYRKDVDYNFF